MNIKRVFLTVLALTLSLADTKAQPVVPGAITSKYAAVLGPRELSFGADGSLYAGCDLGGTGGGGPADPAKIHRIGPGGSPVTEYGNVAIADPDAVIVDRKGAVSGIAGAVLVGGQTSSGIGQVSRVAPDGAVTALFGPSGLYWNPSGFTFDSSGRLLFTEAAGGHVYRASGGAPVNLFDQAEAWSITCDSADRIVVSMANTGKLLLYSASGTLSNANFASVMAGSPVTRGPGGMWTTDVYAITAAGDLIRIALDGTTNKVGNGFGKVFDITFGPDGALYASDFPADTVWRIAPAQIATSTFDIDADGWTGIDVQGPPYDAVTRGPYALNWLPTGGDAGGRVGTTDTAATLYCFSAPFKFLGNHLGWYNGLLQYELRFQNDGLTPGYAHPDVILIGGGLTLVADAGPDPATQTDTWMRFAVLFKEGSWHLDNLTGPNPTASQMQTVLSSVAALYIRGDFFAGLDTTWLDDVVATPASPQLEIAANGNGVVLQWPASVNTFALQTTQNLQATNSWTAVTNAPIIFGTNLQVILNTPAMNAFFRLKL